MLRRLVLLAVVLSATVVRAADVFDQNRLLARSVNILGYDPIWKKRETARFKAEHFRLIHEAGFTGVRVNLYPFRHMQASKDWALKAEWWGTLDWILREAASNKLTVVLDCHEFTAMAEDPADRRGQFFAFWQEVAAHCKDAPDSVLFELLNEPHGKLTPKLWNGYLNEALALVRRSNPTRTVIIGPAEWNSPDHLDELELPAGDSNLIVTVHYYKPMEFTHQGATWSSARDKSGIVWPRDDSERAAISNDFAKVAAWSKAHNRPIFLGEFGAYDKAPLESRVRYAEAVARTAESHGWSWAWWQFDSDFILYDLDKGSWTEPILKALLPAR